MTESKALILRGGEAELLQRIVDYSENKPVNTGALTIPEVEDLLSQIPGLDPIAIRVIIDEIIAKGRDAREIAAAYNKLRDLKNSKVEALENLLSGLYETVNDTEYGVLNSDKDVYFRTFRETKYILDGSKPEFKLLKEQGYTPQLNFRVRLHECYKYSEKALEVDHGGKELQIYLDLKNSFNLPFTMLAFTVKRKDEKTREFKYKGLKRFFNSAIVEKIATSYSYSTEVHSSLCGEKKEILYQMNLASLAKSYAANADGTLFPFLMQELFMLPHYVAEHIEKRTRTLEGLGK